MTFRTDAPMEPVIILPVGVTTNSTPNIAWRSGPHDAFEIKITEGSTPASNILFESGIISSENHSFHCPEGLPANRMLFTWVRVSLDEHWSDWSSLRAPFRIEPLEQPDGTLVHFDLNYTRGISPQLAFEHAHLVAALQGIVNRDEPRLYIDFIDSMLEPEKIDALWLERMREKDGWLAKMTIEPVDDIVALVERFHDDFDGVVIWDPAVPATSNVASTAAGVESLLPICKSDAPDSLYTLLVANGPRLPVKLDLTGLFTGTGEIPDTGRSSTGSAKCDAYIWALERWLKTGKCNPRYLGYYMDAWWIRDPRPGHNWQNHTLTNHDYFIARRGFFFDLSPWGDETPVDDPNQPLGADLDTLKEILQAAWDGVEGREMITAGGFTPWAFKYTDSVDEASGISAGGKHGGVPTEWEQVRIFSAYNVFTDADALHLGGLANASFTQHHPLPERITQPLPCLPDEMRRRGLIDDKGKVTPKNYLMYYVGDYDAAAWTMNALPLLWQRPDRGKVMMNWAINPNLSERARPMFWWIFNTRTEKDYIMAGDDGAGYINPTQLLPPRDPSGLPSGVQAWQNHCAPYYQKFDIDFTGFLIQGRSGKITPEAERVYIPFSSGGVVNQYDDWHVPLHIQDRMPCFALEADLSGNVESDAKKVLDSATSDEVNFLIFRAVLHGPDFYKNLNEAITNQAGEKFEFCTADEMTCLARLHLGADNNRFANYLLEDVPDKFKADSQNEIEFVVRNDGWDTWKVDGANASALGIELTNDGKFSSPLIVSLPHDVVPGDCAIMKIKLTAPTAPGEYTLRCEMRGGTEGWFSATGDAPYRRGIVVK